MNKILLFLLLCSRFGLALNLETDLASFSVKISKELINPEDDYSMGYFLRCQGTSESICFEMCKSSRCLLNEDSCEACISSGNFNMYPLYYDLSKIYRIKSAALEWKQLISAFKQRNLFLINSSSIFGMLTDLSNDEQNETIKKSFRSLCPLTSQNSYLVLSKNQKNFLLLEYLVCEGPYGQVIYQSTFNEDYAHE